MKRRKSFYIGRVYLFIFLYIISRAFIEPISSTLARSIECVTILFVVFYIIRSSITTVQTGRYINVIVVLLIVWGCGIIYRANWDSIGTQFMYNIIGPRGVPLYLLPIIFFLPYNLQSIREILKTFFKISILVIPLWLLNIDSLIQAGLDKSYRSESIGMYLPFISAFLLLFYPFCDRKKNYVNLIITLIYFILMLLNARRNIVFSFFTYGILAYAVYFMLITKTSLIRNVFVFFLLFVSSLVFLINVDSLLKGTFNYLGKRGTEDTRSGVEELFFYDFNRSEGLDWFVGRGMNGTYFREMRNLETDEIESYRNVIETGYLDLVLKGGLISTLLILAILIPAIFKGFRSKKLVGISCSLYLCTYLIDLYTTAPLSSVSVRSILFWFCIAICYRRLRFIDLRIIKGLYKRKIS